MRRMVGLMPDALRLRSLLSPFEATGEELLRELALRIRSFKEAFGAWEALHLTPSRDGLRQESVVQRLRNLKGPSLDNRDAIKSYDAFRSYMNDFETKLFAGTMAYFGNHMSLHASFYKGGRGIVFTAGEDQVPYLLTSIPSFRKLGCTLPMEVLYLGDDDISEDTREKLEALPGVVTRDLSKMIDDTGWKLEGVTFSPERCCRHTDVAYRVGRKAFRDPHVVFPRSDLRRRRCTVLRQPGDAVRRQAVP